MGRTHPRKLKQYESAESYRKFRAFTHMRGPSGELALSPSKSISALTPTSHKEPHIRVAGRLHRVKLTKKK